jgi:hypothetical protein
MEIIQKEKNGNVTYNNIPITDLNHPFRDNKQMEVIMFTKVLSKCSVSVLGLVFTLSVCIGLSANMAIAGNPAGFPTLPNVCGNNDEFTTEFRLEDCRFENKGINPFFILKPGYQIVLESDEEKSVETVLWDTKWIDLDGRKIKTRVLEERAFEWDEEEGEWVTIEISLNWFAICKKTNAVYYFGEFSRDCPDGFNENDVCEFGESNAGSWEAGVNGAMPGVMMTGTPMLGAKYFQEIAPPEAVDRGEIAEMGLSWPESEGSGPGEEPDFTGCIKIFDTNPTPDGECGEEDAKLYCPGIGLVQDQDLKLTFHGFVDDDDDDDDEEEEEEEEDDDDDDDHHKRKRWGTR